MEKMELLHWIRTGTDSKPENPGSCLTEKLFAWEQGFRLKPD